jgi:hypothetical protein
VKERVSEDDVGNHAGLLVILVFVVIVYVLRAIFSAADQSK